MKIQILGTGCPKCKKLYNAVESAVEELQLECELEKVTEIDEIMRMGVVMTPALIVDGETKSVGKVPSVKKLKSMLS
ncbi:MAG: thioredoxin family protein [Kiritimatiellae bacterium]|jgi:small redox-active disulfide protein 2|nr:thioredoxin family protein [Kiritimatiellia bacterium]